VLAIQSPRKNKVARVFFSNISSLSEEHLMFFIA
jgi:hypothetical protein